MTQSSSDIRAGYDLAAAAYADSFLDELSYKPRDVELLRQFASSVGRGRRVLDLGCGPGHTTAHLASLGLGPVGVDWSPQMIAKARSLFPGVAFTVGDFFRLAEQDGTVAGVLALYCIVHLRQEQLLPAFREMLRILEPGGTLLCSFHIGEDIVVQEDFLGSGARLEFVAFPVEGVREALHSAGFVEIEVHERPPYEQEYPTHRCSIFARRPTSA